MRICIKCKKRKGSWWDHLCEYCRRKPASEKEALEFEERYGTKDILTPEQIDNRLSNLPEKRGKISIKNKTLAILGIGAWILSVLSSAEDLAGNYTAPSALIVISAIAVLVFTIMAVVRLWKTQKVTTVLFLASSLTTLVYISAPVKIINFVLFIWVVSLLWTMGKYEGLVKKFQKDSGLTSE